MSGAVVRIGVGTRVMYDGAVHEVTEWLPTVNGTDVVLRGPISVCRMSVVELVSGARVRLLTRQLRTGIHRSDGSGGGGVVESVEEELEEVRERAAHIREVLTGYRSGSSEIAEEVNRAPIRSQPPAGAIAMPPRRTNWVSTNDRPPVDQGVRGERRGGTRSRTICPAEQDRPTVERSSAVHHA